MKYNDKIITLTKDMICNNSELCHGVILNKMETKYGWMVKAVNKVQEVGLHVNHVPNAHEINIIFHQDDGIKTRGGITLRKIPNIPNKAALQAAINNMNF